MVSRIGDWAPERPVFQILIALTSGPRFLLIFLQWLVTRRRGEDAGSGKKNDDVVVKKSDRGRKREGMGAADWIALVGIARTFTWYARFLSYFIPKLIFLFPLNSGGWVYVTSTDHHGTSSPLTFPFQMHLPIRTRFIQKLITIHRSDRLPRPRDDRLPPPHNPLDVRNYRAHAVHTRTNAQKTVSPLIRSLYVDIPKAKGILKRRRKYVALAFFASIPPLVYFFIRHKSQRIPGAYSIYSLFEWGLVLIDVAFDALGAAEVGRLQVCISSIGDGREADHLRGLVASRLP